MVALEMATEEDDSSFKTLWGGVMKQPLTKIFFVLALAAFSLSARAENPIAGVWSFEYTFLKARSFQTGEMFEEERNHGVKRIFIFTENHYSQFAINTETPRPLRAESGEGAMGGPRLQDEQRLAEYAPMDVETGILLPGDEENMFVLRPLLDQIPDYMLGDGAGDRNIWYEVDGDSLTLVRRTEGAVITDYYTRLE